ncbi:enoyl-CoA hydratase-related protein [Aureimonas leprariae]|uniref:Enoyl-CoA hydratase domain-containing protein 3, mitochondrial n=1 Tax=Plantimonas leprariae TaxID=2615207 RepID=A0A7V7PQW9_9HYPH|nr:enoyl-CoA hydratase-related protein [Aureimonas leprariae]KAB0680730.1 enoyl-CoA hydratase [Aureimonas leprariae]
MGEVVEMHAAAEPAARRAVHRVTLSNPPANVLSVAAIDGLLEVLDAAKNDPDCRVVVLAAAGNVFSLGADYEEAGRRRADEDGGEAFFEASERLLAGLAQAIVRHPKPVIAEVAGAASGAGCQLVAACDLAIAAETATFRVPDVNLGLPGAGPMVALSRGLGRKHAMEMLLTGETIDARTAREFGLVNRVVPPEYLTTVVDKYASSIAAKPAEAIRLAKEAFHAQAEMGLAAAYDYAAALSAESMKSEEAREGIRAALSRRGSREAGE